MKYSGELSKPIVSKRIRLLASEAEIEATELEEMAEMCSKFPALFQVHGVEQGNWVALSIELAKAHVPGFKFARPAGRRTEWDLLTRAEFRLDVDNMVAASPEKLSIEEAIKQVCRFTRWAEMTKEKPLGALTKQYYLADMRCVNVVRDARAMNQLSSGIDSHLLGR